MNVEATIGCALLVFALVYQFIWAVRSEATLPTDNK